MKELGSEVAEHGEELPTNPTKDHKTNLLEQGDLFRQNKLFSSSAQEIDKLFLTWLREHQSKEQDDLFKIVCQCLLNVSDKDKDADENVDADQVSTERPVKSATIHRFVHTS